MEVKKAHDRLAGERDRQRQKVAQSRALTERAKREAADKKKEETRLLADFAYSSRAGAVVQNRVNAEEMRRRREIVRIQKEEERQDREELARLQYGRFFSHRV